MLTGLTPVMKTDTMQTHVASFKSAMLQHHASTTDIFIIADKNPEVPVLQCYAASLCLYAQTQTETNTAKHYLARAVTHKTNLTQAETYLFQALNAWSLLHHHEALHLFHHALKANPNDLLPLKYIEWLFHILGQTHHAHLFQSMCEEIAPHHERNPYFLSMYAFALTLAGKRTEALHQATQALSYDPDLAWAQHAIAHVYAMQGNIQAGIQTLTAYQPQWKHLTPKLQSHLYWHLALLHIEENNAKSAMALFENNIWPHRKQNNASAVSTQQDIISFLCRMEIAGMPQDAYWPKLLQDITSVCITPYMPFNSAHYLYVCGKNKAFDLANMLLQQVEQHIKQQTGEAQKTWVDVGLPVIKGMYAFSQKHYLDTIQWFTPIMPHINRIGGSDAESDLFHMIYCFSLLQADQKNQATQHFNHYLSHHLHTHLHTTWFSNVPL
jgi:tetratricopeptide (TPR) repeat protein